MPFIQFTKAKAKIGPLGSVQMEDAGKIILNIEPNDVRMISDENDYRIITYVCPINKLDSDDQHITTGTIAQTTVLEEFSYVVNTIGIKGVIGS